MRADPEPDDHAQIVHCPSGPIAVSDFDTPNDIKWVPEVQLQRSGIRFQQPVPFACLLLDVMWELVKGPAEVRISPVD
jgi:hypothetical protein